jgi:hypothetical protein
MLSTLSPEECESLLQARNTAQKRFTDGQQRNKRFPQMMEILREREDKHASHRDHR